MTYVLLREAVRAKHENLSFVTIELEEIWLRKTKEINWKINKNKK